MSRYFKNAKVVSKTSVELIDENNERWRAMCVAHGAAIRMVREAIETLFGPVASLEGPDAVLLRGPEPHHDAEAIIAALQNVKDELDMITKEMEIYKSAMLDYGHELIALKLNGVPTLET